VQQRGNDHDQREPAFQDVFPFEQSAARGRTNRLFPIGETIEDRSNIV